MFLGAVEALPDPAGPDGLEELVEAVAGRLSGGPEREKWLALAVFTARLPDEGEVIELIRRVRLDGATSILAPLLIGGRVARFLPAINRRLVEVLREGVVVDVDHTSRVAFATGIQRVVREACQRWARDHDPIFVGWTPDRSALRRLGDAERATALYGGPPARVDRFGRAVVVPYGADYLLPELSTDQGSMRRVAAMARWMQGRSGAIGFDTVPLSSPETTDPGMPAAFANSLGAVRHMARVAAISEAAAIEYRGWVRMLAGTGLHGPAITAVGLGHDHGGTRSGAVRPSPEGRDSLVLCVGSHEPRKNHLAVLHAAEVLWRKGQVFELVFIGGNAWRSDEFIDRVNTLVERGRDVKTLASVADDDIDAFYRRARVSVFPSLNEGFGLPIVESLVRGTPVITSDFGSMKEVGAAGGTLFVNPRDDDEIVAALESILTDDVLCRDLGHAAMATPARSWDEYARETWDYLLPSPSES